MSLAGLIRQHWAALRALLVLTTVVGIGYPILIWMVAQVPGLRERPMAPSSSSTKDLWPPV